MIIAEIGDFSRFDSADKVLVYARTSPSTYQSGQLDNCYSHMENVVTTIFDTPFTIRPNMSAIWIQRLLNTWQKTSRR